MNYLFEFESVDMFFAGVKKMNVMQVKVLLRLRWTRLQSELWEIFS